MSTILPMRHVKVKWVWISSLLTMLLTVLGVVNPIHAQPVHHARSVCGGGMVTTGTHYESLLSGGLTRHYLVHIPAAYDGHTPLSVVLSLHGFASYGADQEKWSQWTPIADRENFIVVYPEGTGLPLQWNAGNSSYMNKTVDDVAFFTDLFDHFDTTYCIDDARIFVTGFSNGGGMTNRLACELSGRIAAIGTVSGAYSPFAGGCTPVRPIPVITFHGDADPIVNYNGDANQNFPPIKDWVANWAQRNGCKQGPETIALPDAITDVTAIAYHDCQLNAEVQFYTIHGGGHSWPGGMPTVPAQIIGKTASDFNASEIMWTFFQQHGMTPLP